VLVAMESEKDYQRSLSLLLLLIVHTRGAIPNEMGPTRCRVTPALNQSADEILTPAEEDSNSIIFFKR
jgi:hypothetical protein